MLGAFLVPLLLGALPLFLMRKAALLPGDLLLQLHACSVASFAFGSVFKGILDIYGTTNRLAAFYPAAGAFFALLFASVYLKGLSAMKKKESR